MCSICRFLRSVRSCKVILPTVLEEILEHLTEQQADIMLLRVTMMTLITRQISDRPDFAEERLNDVRASALEIIGRMSFDAPTPQEAAHAKAVTRQRTENLFHEIALALLELRRKTGESGKN